MYCSKCGNQIADDARFCNVCGAENVAASGNTTAANPSTVNQSVPGQNSANTNAGNQNAGYQNTSNQNPYNQNRTYQNTSGANTTNKSDYQANKVIFMLSYLGILFFLPLVCCPNSKPGKFHANQGLVLLITSVVGQIALGIIDFVLPWSLWALSSLLSFAWSGCMIALVVIGMVYAYKEEERPLPVIGGIRIIK